jgi:hypothetical protein
MPRRPFRDLVRSALVFPLVALLTPAGHAEYADDWGPVTGSSVQLFEAYDQDGELRTLDNISGEQGLLLFLNRSADW